MRERLTRAVLPSREKPRRAWQDVGGSWGVYEGTERWWGRVDGEARAREGLVEHGKRIQGLVDFVVLRMAQVTPRRYWRSVNGRD